MMRQLKFILPVLLFMLAVIGCTTEPNAGKNKIIKSIKKEVVAFTDGSTLDLGGDSIAKVFYLIRHAEKDTQKNDPFLNEAGLERAIRLNTIFRQTYLDAVYSTLFNRTLHTVDSITQYKGLSNSIYTNKNMKARFEEVLQSPTINKVLVVGHSNTIPPLANFLYGSNYFNKIFKEDEYNHFVIVVHHKNGNKVLYELKY